MRGAVILAVAALLSACGSRESDDRVTTVDLEAKPGDPAPPVPPSPSAVATPAADLSAAQLTPEAEKGEKGARNVLLEWARALERRDFARADAQWGEAAGEADSAGRYARYAKITVALGEGDVEGAAGSLYYAAPVTVTGERAGGGAETLSGTIAARRVNDVDGATPAQLRWHIASIVL